MGPCKSAKGLPESFKVGWYSLKKTRSSHLNLRKLHCGSKLLPAGTLPCKAEFVIKLTKSIINASKRNHFTKLFYYKSFQSALYGTLKEGRKTREYFQSFLPGGIQFWTCMLCMPCMLSVVSILSLSCFKPGFSSPTEGQLQAYTV